MRRPSAAVSGLAAWLLAAAAWAQGEAPPRPRQPGEGPELLNLNSKLSGVYNITRFDKKLGNCSVLIDPYYGQSQPTRTDEASYRHNLNFADTFQEGGVDRPFNITSETNARLSRGAKSEVTYFEFRYEFAGNVLKASYDAVRTPGQVLKEVNGVITPAKLEPAAGTILAFTPELGFMQLVQNKLLYQDTKFKFLLVLPSDKELVVKELQMRVIGPEERRYTDQLMSVYHLVVDDTKENPLPEFFSIRHFYIDGYGRVLEYSTVDETRIFLATETQFTKVDRPLETWYKNIYVIPQNQEERHIGWFSSNIELRAEGLKYKAERILKRVMLEVIRDHQESWEIVLTPAYQIESLAYTRSFAGSGIKAEYKAQTKKVLYSTLDGKPVSEAEVPPEQSFYGTIDLAMFILVQKEELLKANIHSAVVIDPDNRTVVPISISQKGVSRRDYLDAKFYCLQTQIMVDEEVRAEIYLDKYGRALELSWKEKYKEGGGGEQVRDGLRTIVTKNHLTAMGGAKEPTPPSVFLNPMTRKSTTVEVLPHVQKFQELERSYTAMRKVWEPIDRAIKTQNPTEVEELFPRLKEAFEKFLKTLGEYRGMLDAAKGIEEEARVPVWESSARKWYTDAEKRIDKSNAVLQQFNLILGRVIQAIKERKVDEAKKMVPEIGRLLESPDANPQARQSMANRWKPVLQALEDLEIEIKLDRVEFDIPAIAWEMDYVERPFGVKFDLFGSGLELAGQTKIARVRAACVISNKFYREGDVIEAEGLKLTVSKIAKDKVTVKISRFTKEFPMRR
jgi:hypothetical protein